MAAQRLDVHDDSYASIRSHGLTILTEPHKVVVLFHATLDCEATRVWAAHAPSHACRISDPVRMSAAYVHVRLAYFAQTSSQGRMLRQLEQRLQR